MRKSENSGLPLFFNYQEFPVDAGYEFIQDFHLSWIIRCADDKFKMINSLLHEYAKRTVFSLINGFNNEVGFIIDKEMSNDFRISNIKTKRQWERIDLIAELEVEENSLSKKYVLNIENKWYTKISRDQLAIAKMKVERVYGNCEIINLVIFCDDYIIKNSNQKQLCKNSGYKYLTIEDIKDLTKMKKGEVTNNFLFDEYWF